MNKVMSPCGTNIVADENSIEKCVKCFNNVAASSSIIKQCLPVPAFGDPTSKNIRVATVGLNPSSAEFLAGIDLKPSCMRLPALVDFGVNSRVQLKPEHLREAKRRRADYFSGKERSTNEWFKRLSAILDGCGQNWKYENGNAVHVDIVACVTNKSWSDLTDAVALALTENCRDHLMRTLSALSADALLLFDGKSACNAVAGMAEHEWEELCRFTDCTGQRKPLRIRCGTVKVGVRARRFFAWNIPVKHLSDEALLCLSEWLRCRLSTERDCP